MSSKDPLLMNWDELNILRESAVDLVRQYKTDGDKEKVRKWCDYFGFVMCLIYEYGWKDAEAIVGIVPFKDGLDDKAVNLDINGETYRERVEKQVEAGSLDGVLRIIDTEAHRDYNTAVYDCGMRYEEAEATVKGKGAKNSPSLRKKWYTMRDNRVRDTHDYLEGAVVGLDDRFYTYDGDSARFPGDFALPENNVNCRCFVALM